MDKKEVLIEVKDLKKYFQVGRNQTLKAVDGVNFKNMRFVSLMNSQADKDSVLESQEHLLSNQNSSFAMSRFQLLTFPFRHRLSTC